MIKLDSIINGLTILLICLEKEGEVRVNRFDFVRSVKSLRLSMVREYPNCLIREVAKIKNPVLVVVTGYGVIQKSFGEGELKEWKRITESDEFLWECRNTGEGRCLLAFTRKEKIADCLHQIEQYRVAVVGVHVGDVLFSDAVLGVGEMDTKKMASLLAEKYFDGGIEWRELFKAGTRNHVFCSLLLNRIKLPCLLLLLLLLGINFWWNNKVKSNIEPLKMELLRLEADVVHREKLSGEMEKMIREFGETEKHVFAPLLDKIAVLVPQEVVFETMTMNPLLKMMEEGKPLTVRQGYIEITGTTIFPEKVTFFTTELTTLPFIREVKLISIDKDQNNGWFNFKIWIRL